MRCCRVSNCREETKIDPLINNPTELQKKKAQNSSSRGSLILFVNRTGFALKANSKCRKSLIQGLYEYSETCRKTQKSKRKEGNFFDFSTYVGEELFKLAKLNMWQISPLKYES